MVSPSPSPPVQKYLNYDSDDDEIPMIANSSENYMCYQEEDDQPDYDNQVEDGNSPDENAEQVLCDEEIQPFESAVEDLVYPDSEFLDLEALLKENFNVEFKDKSNVEDDLKGYILGTFAVCAEHLQNGEYMSPEDFDRGLRDATTISVMTLAEIMYSENLLENSQLERVKANWKNLFHTEFLQKIVEVETGGERIRPRYYPDDKDNVEFHLLLEKLGIAAMGKRVKQEQREQKKKDDMELPRHKLKYMHMNNFLIYIMKMIKDNELYSDDHKYAWQEIQNEFVEIHKYGTMEEKEFEDSKPSDVNIARRRLFQTYDAHLDLSQISSLNQKAVRLLMGRGNAKKALAEPVFSRIKFDVDTDDHVGLCIYGDPGLKPEERLYSRDEIDAVRKEIEYAKNAAGEHYAEMRQVKKLQKEQQKIEEREARRANYRADALPDPDIYSKNMELPVHVPGTSKVSATSSGGWNAKEENSQFSSSNFNQNSGFESQSQARPAEMPTPRVFDAELSSEDENQSDSDDSSDGEEELPKVKAPQPIPSRHSPSHTKIRNPYGEEQDDRDRYVTPSDKCSNRGSDDRTSGDFRSAGTSFDDSRLRNEPLNNKDGAQRPHRREQEEDVIPPAPLPSANSQHSTNPPLVARHDFNDSREPIDKPKNTSFSQSYDDRSISTGYEQNQRTNRYDSDYRARPPREQEFQEPGRREPDDRQYLNYSHNDVNHSLSRDRSSGHLREEGRNYSTRPQRSAYEAHHSPPLNHNYRVEQEVRGSYQQPTDSKYRSYRDEGECRLRNLNNSYRDSGSGNDGYYPDSHIQNPDAEYYREQRPNSSWQEAQRPTKLRDRSQPPPPRSVQREPPYNRHGDMSYPPQEPRANDRRLDMSYRTVPLPHNPDIVRPSPLYPQREDDSFHTANSPRSSSRKGRPSADIDYDNIDQLPVFNPSGRPSPAYSTAPSASVARLGNSRKTIECQTLSFDQCISRALEEIQNNSEVFCPSDRNIKSSYIVALLSHFFIHQDQDHLCTLSYIRNSHFWTFFGDPQNVIGEHWIEELIKASRERLGACVSDNGRDVQFIWRERR